MLPGGDSTELTGLLQTLPCRVSIPAWYQALIGQRGPVAVLPDEKRRFARHSFTVKAVLEYRANLPALPRTSEPQLVLCKDLSRSGISFLHAEPLFPGEEVTLWLPTGRRSFTVRRCRRHEERCYEIGAQ